MREARSLRDEANRFPVAFVTIKRPFLAELKAANFGVGIPPTALAAERAANEFDLLIEGNLRHRSLS